MGTTTWDKKFVKDAELSYSHVHFRKSKRILIVHRELELRANEVNTLARALANTQTDPFVPTVPNFLRNWQPLPGSPSPSGTRYGLAILAGLIQPANSPVFRNRRVRFGINPVPKNASTKPDGTYRFEIRVVFHFGTTVQDDEEIDVGGPDRLDEENFDPNNTPALASPTFHAALADIKGRLPAYTDFLDAVFPNADQQAAKRRKKKSKKAKRRITRSKTAKRQRRK